MASQTTVAPKVTAPIATKASPASKALRFSFDPKALENIGKSVTIWDLLMVVATLVCCYVALQQNNMGAVYHIVVSVLLFVLALRVAVVKLSCNVPLSEPDKERVMQWSALFISYLAIRGAVSAGAHKQYVRTIMEGIVGFLFLFVFIKSLGRLFVKT